MFFNKKKNRVINYFNENKPVIMKYELGFTSTPIQASQRTYKEINWNKATDKEALKQLATNELANVFNIYNGSRLPENPGLLLKQGWKEIPNYKDKTGIHQEYWDPSTGQKVKFHMAQPDKEGFRKTDHYHWENPASQNDFDVFLNKYGGPVNKGNKHSHILSASKEKKD